MARETATRIARRWRWWAIATATVGVLVAALALCIVWPLDARRLARPSGEGITITDRTGTVLRTTRAADGQRQQWLALDAVDPLLVAAIVALEDRRFTAHHGIAWRALARAARDNLFAGRIVSGASTITMQLARLLTGAPRSPFGKVQQLVWALRLEWHLDKRTILEQYLNRMPLGQGTVGVDAAARLYAGTGASQLSPGTAALLAALARAPSRDNPIAHPARAIRARARAIDQLLLAGVLTPDVAALARDEPVLAPPRERMRMLAPHFTTRVLAWLDDSARAGEVRTTLDQALQVELEGDVRDAMRQLDEKGARDAAVVVLDNATGDVRAWIGSPDFWRPAVDTTRGRSRGGGQVDMVIGERQPGSALKPFVYALAFDRGLSPATVLADLPRTFTTATGSYSPRNYDRRFHGPVRARDALASSYNIPAVLLADRLGASAVHHTLQTAGLTSLSESAEYYGLGLALGNGEVSLIALANAYRALANGGVHLPWRWQTTDTTTIAPRRVVSTIAAAQVLDILADPSARLAGFGDDTPFDFPFPVAVKTGTSRHFTDNWAIAATGGFTVAVWVGNFDGTPMRAVSGISGAGPLLRRAVWRTAARVAPGALRTPAEAGARRVRVCRASGLRAVHECPSIEEWLSAAQEAALADCDWHRAGGGVVWPAEYRAWAEQTGRAVALAEALGDGRSRGGDLDDSATRSTPGLAVTRPTAPGAVAAAEPATLALTSPRDGDRYELPAGEAAQYATIALRAVGARPAAVRWFIDGRPYTARRWRLEPGTHVIRAESGRRGVEARITVERPG
ncbi:MAG: penicillin-binding protein 1C [Gemmatimonadaceae bacterium]|jgi:penicillin-binding protein 1C|nr:penicillin-binding protein 1C [Gemmatimonadaceae bacterium]